MAAMYKESKGTSPFRTVFFILGGTLLFIAGGLHERWRNDGRMPGCAAPLAAPRSHEPNVPASVVPQQLDVSGGRDQLTESQQTATQGPVETATTSFPAAQLSGPADAQMQKCMKLGEEYAAKLPPWPGVNNAFNLTFQSPVTTSRDGTFLRMAQSTGTDKVTAHSYHYIYTRYLAHARFEPLNILEIGLGCDMGYGPGASLKLWRAYLPCAKISFLEFNAPCATKFKAAVEEAGGGKLYIGSQDNAELLETIRAHAKAIGGFDMIIDDGSHRVEHQFATLEGLWSAVKPGGAYVIEDLHDHWKRADALDPVPISEKPKLVVPLYTHLMHLINCHGVWWRDYEARTLGWCESQAKESQYRDVINLDIMPEAAVMVKGAAIGGPPQLG